MRGSVRFIHHEHSDILGRSLLYRCALWYAVRRNYTILTVSEYLNQYILRNFTVEPTRVITIHNFCNSEYYAPATESEKYRARTQLHIPHHALTIGYSGRIIPRKGWNDFLKVCATLKREQVVFRAIVAGDGPEYEKLRDTVTKLRLDDSVHLLGHISDMKSFFHALDMYIMSSHWEGFSMVQLEVMASGLPMISTNGPGLTEVAEAGRSAMYCNVSDIECMSAAVKKIALDHELRKTLSRNARARACIYTKAAYIDVLCAAYKKILP
jgi:glycosyltransferase involved in cell wall biosynthesis